MGSYVVHRREKTMIKTQRSEGASRRASHSQERKKKYDNGDFVVRKEEEE